MSIITEIKSISIFARRARLYKKIMRARRERSRLRLDLNIENCKYQSNGRGQNLAVRVSELSGLLGEYKITYRLLNFELDELGRAEKSEELNPQPGGLL